MGYTTPFTAVAATAWKAADWNTYGRDNIAWLATDAPSCHAYNNAAISVVNGGTGQALTLNSERFDNAAMHSTSSNTDRITVPTGGGGKYLIGGHIEFAASSAGAARAIFLALGGVTSIARQVIPPTTSGNTPSISCMTIYAMSAADFTNMWGYQDSGGAINVDSAANYSPEFWAFWFRN